MSNLQRHESRGTVMWVVVFVLILALVAGMLAALTGGFKNWNIKTWFGSNDYSVTYSLPEGVEFRSDATVKTKYKSGDRLVLPSADDFAAEDNTGTLLGWYNVDTAIEVTAETEVSENGLTVAPYWKNVDGYTSLNVGRTGSKGYQLDKMPTDLRVSNTDATGRTTFNYLGSTLGRSRPQIICGGSGYSVQGSIISDTAAVTAGSAMRIDSGEKLTIGDTANGDPIEYRYTVWNNGDTPLHLSIYQVQSGNDYQVQKSYYYYEENYYRVNIELMPGESTTAVGQYMQSNTNNLTYVVFEKDVSAFSFGIGIGYKKISAIDTTKYSAALSKLDNSVTLNYDPDINEGITVKAEYLTLRAGRFITAPVLGTDYTLPEGVSVTKWQLYFAGVAYDIPAGIKSYTSLRVRSSGGTLKAITIKI